ncbi:hypothetical protein BO70DRAFT_103293 [Aspergillus heteromorphus CBS 117.55]|uniref:Uncharacterized protein n=1 Tax=Aspergillus heteromorphus CBS 117.55 TaxID=1448321 RepID=A0A317VLE8_9EURO|nr:uncharacterized protein BO70DRAFT_103293 [Aspergillus heteromorphus CBS 117.55]PWY75166.1 hypothetical protein BO70DRAFT_103293 [Aspergillus heteromorphus CBS 117.55]
MNGTAGRGQWKRTSWRQQTQGVSLVERASHGDRLWAPTRRGSVACLSWVFWSARRSHHVSFPPLLSLAMAIIASLPPPC